MSSQDVQGYLIRQFETAWKLLQFHLNGLSTEECLWRPAAEGLHVHRDADGAWRADWPEREDYTIGAPSIAWITWHVVFWWSMALDRNFGNSTLTRDAIIWPGSADGVRATLDDLRTQWLAALGDADFHSPERSQWPYRDRPFGDVVAWANIELTKNAAEIGYARFLYASSAQRA